MPIINPNFTTRMLKGFNDNVLDSKIMNKMIYAPAKANPAKFAGKMALVSALTKDAVGCYYYVTQSLNNEKIPEEKRKFVASLDLMNGILNVALQFTVGMWIDKKAPQWFDRTVGKSLNTDETVKEAHRIHQEIQKMHLKEKVAEVDVANFLREKMLGSGGRATKLLKVGFSAAAVLVATQIITKRVIVPFLATPLASWYKENYLDKTKTSGAAKKGETEAKAAAPQQAGSQLNLVSLQQKPAFAQFAKK